MKTLIRTIAVFCILTLATVSTAMDEVDTVEVIEAEKQQIVTEKEQMDAVKMEMEAAKEEMDKPKVQLESIFGKTKAISAVRPGVVATREFTLGTGWPRYGDVEEVLVIPASQMDAKELLTIQEDMSVMSRILDKELDLSPGGIVQHIYGGRTNLRFFDSTGARSTEAIFMQGYGALFLMKVDFPLLPAIGPEEEKEPKKEEIDPVWEETKREIYEPADARRKRADEEEKEEYDEDKVEEMKETLIKALKHAANIRNLKLDEWVILTVTGEGGQGSGGVGRVFISKDQIVVKDQDSKVEKIYEAPFSEEMRFTSPAVLTIRVKKSDVDAFARDELDFEGFHKRVQMFIY